MIARSIGLAILARAACVAVAQQPGADRPQLDTSRPVPAKSEVLAAWRKRQAAITSFRFAWTEEQAHLRGWLANPRYPERERAGIPALLVDRSYVVTKTLTVAGDKMRYSFELDRPEEADGVEVVSPRGAPQLSMQGLGVRRHYRYVSTFDGRQGITRVTSLLDDSPPASEVRSTANVDAQTLDGRAILMAFRPLDAVMGHLLIERAVTNRVRTFYHGQSTFLLEERHDPSGWKTILRIEPERDFLVSEYFLLFEQKRIADIDIDYVRDPRWGWVPSGWRVTEMLADGSRRLVAVAKVTSYSINAPNDAAELR
jgi:hypothetical protein